MPDKSEKPRKLIEKLEASSKLNPGAYRLKVLLLACLGYAHLTVTLAVSIVIGLAAITVFFLRPGMLTGYGLALVAAPAFGVAWGVLKAIRVEYEAPVGRQLTRDDNPELFDRIEAMRVEVNAPRIHEILLVDELNAAIVGVPKLGFLGWHRNYLILGVPLMAALSPQEFDSVIGHELGHLSRSHGRIASWLYRIRATWGQLSDNLDGRGGFVFDRFFSWYVPYFNAYSFVLARNCEFEADEASASVTSPEIVTSSLARITIVDQHLDEVFWPAIADATSVQSEPPDDLFQSMVCAMRESVSAPQSSQYLASALQRRPGLVDTHPPLKYRIEAFGVEPGMPTAFTQSAGEHYFGGRFETLLHEYSLAWRARNLETWGAQHKQLAEVGERLAELEAEFEASEAEPPAEDMWEYIALIDYQQGAEAALPLLMKLRERVENPERLGSVEFHIGRILAERGDRAGLDHLSRSMKLDESRTLNCCDLAIDYHFEHGVRTDAQPWIDHSERFERKIQEAKRERETLSKKDTCRAGILATARRRVQRTKRILEQVQGIPRRKEGSSLPRSEMLHPRDSPRMGPPRDGPAELPGARRSHRGPVRGDDPRHGQRSGPLEENQKGQRGTHLLNELLASRTKELSIVILAMCICSTACTTTRAQQKTPGVSGVLFEADEYPPLVWRIQNQSYHALRLTVGDDGCLGRYFDVSGSEPRWMAEVEHACETHGKYVIGPDESEVIRVRHSPRWFPPGEYQYRVYDAESDRVLVVAFAVEGSSRAAPANPEDECHTASNVDFVRWRAQATAATLAAELSMARGKHRDAVLTALVNRPALWNDFMIANLSPPTSSWS